MVLPLCQIFTDFVRHEMKGCAKFLEMFAKLVHRLAAFPGRSPSLLER